MKRRTNVAFDRALHGHVPSVFRQNPEDSEKCPPLIIAQLRGQVGGREHKSRSQAPRPNNTQIYEGAAANCSNRIAQDRPRQTAIGR